MTEHEFVCKVKSSKEIQSKHKDGEKSRWFITGFIDDDGTMDCKIGWEQDIALEIGQEVTITIKTND